MTRSHPQVRYCCETCGQPVDHAYRKQTVERDGVELIDQIVSFNSCSARLQFSQSEVLRALMLHGRRSMEAVIITLGTESEIADELIRVHISRLRAVLRDIGAPFIIKSVRGWGYELVAA